jgi:flagellar hook-associated protein 3 FlgL
MTRVSTFGQNQFIINQMLRSQANLYESQTQMSTGRVSTKFEGYARDANALLATKTVVAQKEAFLAANKELETRLEIQNLALGEIAQQAENLRQQIISSTGLNDGTGFNFEAEGFFSVFVSVLNTQHQGSFVFGGTNNDVPPVNISSVAELVALPDAASAFDNNSIKLSQKVDDNRTIEYGVLANEVGEPIMNAMKRLFEFEAGILPPGAGAFAPAGPMESPLTANQQAFLISELTNVLTAIDNARDYEAINGVHLSSLAALEQRQTQDRDFGRMLASEIENVDLAEAITNLQQDEIQLEATLNVTARLTNLSLIDFI